MVIFHPSTYLGELLTIGLWMIYYVVSQPNTIIWKLIRFTTRVSDYNIRITIISSTPCIINMTISDRLVDILDTLQYFLFFLLCQQIIVFHKVNMTNVFVIQVFSLFNITFNSVTTAPIFFPLLFTFNSKNIATIDSLILFCSSLLHSFPTFTLALDEHFLTLEELDVGPLILSSLSRGMPASSKPAFTWLYLDEKRKSTFSS